MGKKTEILSPEAAEALRADVMRLATIKKKIKDDIQALVLEREAIRDGIPVSHPSKNSDSLWAVIKKEAMPRIQKRWGQLQHVIAYMTYTFLTALRSFLETYDDGSSPNLTSLLQKIDPIIRSLGIMIRYAYRQTEKIQARLVKWSKAKIEQVAAKIHAWQVELESKPSPEPVVLQEPATALHKQPATMSFTLKTPSFLVSTAKSPAIQELSSRERLDRLLNTAFEDLMNQNLNATTAQRS